MVKEFLALLKDKRSRVVLIVPPIVQLLVFGYAATFDLNHVPYAVYNEDSSLASREFLAAFEGSSTFELVDVIENDSQIAPLIVNKKALMILRLGPNFSRDLLSGRTASVQLIVDGRDSNTAMIVLGYARGIVIDFSGQWALDHGQPLPPARLDIRAWFNPNLESRWFVVPGIVGLLTLVVTMLVTALSVAREREAGTLDQLLVTPFAANGNSAGQDPARIRDRDLRGDLYHSFGQTVVRGALEGKPPRPLCRAYPFSPFRHRRGAI